MRIRAAWPRAVFLLARSVRGTPLMELGAIGANAGPVRRDHRHRRPGALVLRPHATDRPPPGDVTLRGDRWTIYVPIATSIVLSVLLTLILSLVAWMQAVVRVRSLLILAAVVVGCGRAAEGLPFATSSAATSAVPVVWASYELHSEPRHRLLFEGGTDGTRFSELRIRDRSGGVVAQASAAASDSDPLVLCGPTKSGPARLHGPMRVSLPVTPDLFKSFAFATTADYSIEVRVRTGWVGTELRNLCHATE